MTKREEQRRPEQTNPLSVEPLVSSQSEAERRKAMKALGETIAAKRREHELAEAERLRRLEEERLAAERAALERATREAEARAKAAAQIPGMPCPKCGCLWHSVTKSRRSILGRIYRRRTCNRCGEKFSTYERVAKSPPRPPSAPCATNGTSPKKKR